MKPRTLWIIILKSFGIYGIMQLYYPLTQLSSLLFTLSNSHFTDSWQPIGYVLLSISIYLTMVLLFIFKTHWLIDVLKLDQTIKEEKIEINIHRSTVLIIVVMLSGILIFTDNLPLLLKEFYAYFEVINNYSSFKQYPHAGTMVAELVKMLFGFFMMTSSRLIVNFIERKRKRDVVEAQ